MSHIDEGALHAYLDGALDEYPVAEADRIRQHLDACAECAERLEVERAVRTDAHAILGLAAPVVEAPSFEELRAYVQRTRPSRSGMNRMQRMGWAASVVLALGTGWMLRESQLQSRAPFGADDALMAPSEEQSLGSSDRLVEGLAAPADEGAAARQGTEDEAPNMELGQEAPSPEPAAPATFIGRTDAKAGEVPVEADALTLLNAVPGDAERTAAATPARDMAVVEPVVDAASVPVTAGEAVAFRTERAAAGADTVGREAMDLVAGGQRIDSAGSTLTSGAGASAAVEEATRVATPVRAAEPSAVEPARAEARRRAEQPAPVVSALERGTPELQARPEAEADLDAALADEPLLSVPGYEVVDVTNLGEGTTPFGARVQQRMPDGRAFEVIHLEPEVDPSVLPALPDGWGETAAESQAGWVFVRGGLSRAELDEMLALLFPGTP